MRTKIFLLLACLLLLAAGCATVSVRAEKTHSELHSSSFGRDWGEVRYYTGHDEPAASSGVVMYNSE